MKHQYLVLMLVVRFVCTSVIAQPVVNHQRSAGGSSFDDLSAMYLTRDGGLIAGGYSLSNISGEKTENNRGISPYTNDYWIVKYDDAGNIQWDKTIGGDNDDALTSLQQTNDGGYILGGYSTSNISYEKTQNNRCGCTDMYNSDYWIVKLDSLGKIQWDKTIGGNGEDRLNALQQTSDGGYILGGYSKSGISGEKTGSNRGESDYWIVKLDNLGNIQWDKTIGGSNQDGLNALQQTKDGGFILGGTSFSSRSGEKTENPRGEDDYWVVKLDRLGRIEWDKTIGGGSYEVLTSLQQTTDRGYILGGYSRSNAGGEKTENNRDVTGYSNDYWIVKLDSAGNVVKDKTIGGSSYEEFGSLQQTSDGGYILGGYSGSNISGEKTENSKGSWDYWVVKLDKSGVIQWDKTIGGSKTDYLLCIKETEPNRYALGGWSDSKISGDKTTAARGERDYWLVELKYNTLKGITSNTIHGLADIGHNKQITVYPNPARDILHIHTNGTVTFTLTDASGKVILTKTITGPGEINVAVLGAGLYYLKNNETGTVQKVIISK